MTGLACSGLARAQPGGGASSAMPKRRSPAVVIAAWPPSASASARARSLAPRWPPSSGTMTAPSSETASTGGSSRLSARQRRQDADQDAGGADADDRAPGFEQGSDVRRGVVEDLVGERSTPLPGRERPTRGTRAGEGHHRRARPDETLTRLRAERGLGLSRPGRGGWPAVLHMRLRCPLSRRERVHLAADRLGSAAGCGEPVRRQARRRRASRCCLRNKDHRKIRRIGRRPAPAAARPVRPAGWHARHRSHAPKGRCGPAAPAAAADAARP